MANWWEIQARELREQCMGALEEAEQLEAAGEVGHAEELRENADEFLESADRLNAGDPETIEDFWDTHLDYLLRVEEGRAYDEIANSLYTEGFYDDDIPW